MSFPTDVSPSSNEPLGNSNPVKCSAKGRVEVKVGSISHLRRRGATWFPHASKRKGYQGTVLSLSLAFLFKTITVKGQYLIS